MFFFGGGGNHYKAKLCLLIKAIQFLQLHYVEVQMQYKISV